MTEDTPPNPKRRRWRWLVVPILFALGLGGWWLNATRVDHRLIGRWEALEVDDRVLTFESTGWAFKGERMRWRWWVYGGRLVEFGSSSDQWWEVTLSRLSYIASWTRSRSAPRGFANALLTFIDEDTFQLRYDDGTTIAFRRLKN